MRDKHTGTSRGFGFVTFADPSSVDKVLAQSLKLDGRSIECKLAVPRGQVQPTIEYDTKRNKIFVGGIPLYLTDAQFTSFFSRFGEIKDATVMRDVTTGTSRGFGFVSFADPTSVEKVLSQPLKIDGRDIEAKIAVPRAQVQSRKIFIGGLPLSLTQEDLKDYFSQYGAIVETSIQMTREGRSRGFGFITFEAESAYQQVIGTKTHTIANKTVEVKRVVPKGRKEVGDVTAAYGGVPYGGYGYPQAPATGYEGYAPYPYGEYGYPPPRATPGTGSYSGSYPSQATGGAYPTNTGYAYAPPQPVPPAFPPGGRGNTPQPNPGSYGAYPARPPTRTDRAYHPYGR